MFRGNKHSRPRSIHETLIKLRAGGLAVRSLGAWVLLALLLLPAALAEPENLSNGIPWLPNLIDGGGFSPEESDPAGTPLLDDPAFSFTPGNTTRVTVPNTIGPFEKINVTFTVVVPDAGARGHLRPVLDVRNACSHKRIMKVYLRTPAPDHPGQVLIDARGLPKIVTGDIALDPGTYLLTATFDLADSEAYVRIARPDGTVLQTAGGSLNADGANTVRAEQTVGDVALIFGAIGSDPDQIISVPLGWTFRDLDVRAVPAGTDSGVPGPDGADLGSDDGRLAFLAATLTGAAREEGGDWSLDCGPVGEVLPVPPGDAPADAGRRYCALDIDGDIVFGTFGTGGAGTPESRILASLQDIAYRLHVDDDEIDPTACDAIDTTLGSFQQCPDAIEGMRTYAFVHPVTGTSFLVVSDSAIDAFSTSWLESIGAFFRGLFGIPEDTAGVMSGIPLRRFHHAFLADRQGREIAATWLDRDATLLYRSFTTDLNAWTPADADYRLDLGAQLFIAELDDDAPSDVRAWRQLTSGLRVQDAPGDPIGGGSCGDGIVGIGEQCEPGLPLTCGEFSGNASDTRPVPCGAPGSATACIPDTAVCEFNSSCGDDWDPVPRPLPCGAPLEAEPGDDPLCRGDAGSSCQEGFCFCAKAMMKVLRGEEVEFNPLVEFFSDPVETMFTNHGSENKPVMCRAARYFADGNAEDRQWFETYFAWQVQKDRHMGTEIFSPLYTPAVVAANTMVRAKAAAIGDTELENAAKAWLRATWGLAALGTSNVPIRSYTVQVHGVPQSFESDDDWSGITVAVAGTRSIPRNYAWFALHKELAYVADTSPRPGRAYNWFPVHAILLTGGVEPGDDISIPDGLAISAEAAGITQDDRAVIKRMISTGAGFSDIKAMVGGAKPAVAFTFVRTSDGVMSYIGTWAPGSAANPTGHNVNGNKAATMAVRILNDGSFRSLYPHTIQKTGNMGIDSWREEVSGANGRVCGKNLGVTDCIDLPGGSITLVAEWSPEHGLRCLAGCGGDGGSGDTGACGTVVAAQGSYDILVRRGASGPELKVSYVPDSPDVESEKEPACYRNGGSVGTDIGQITFNDAWIPHAPGSETEVYKRIKKGGGEHFDLRIVARADADGWTITGTRQGVANPNNGGVGHTCWSCQAPYCESMNLRILLSSVPAQNPACQGTCTRKPLGETCNDSGECCSDRCEDRGGVLQCVVSGGGSGEPPDGPPLY